MRKKQEKKIFFLDFKLDKTSAFQKNYPLFPKLFRIIASWYLRFIIITFCDWWGYISVYFPCLLVSYLILIYVFPENFELFGIFTH